MTNPNSSSIVGPSEYPRELYGSPFWRKLLIEHPDKVLLIEDPVFENHDLVGGELVGVYVDEDEMCVALDKFEAEGRYVIWRGTGRDPSILMF